MEPLTRRNLLVLGATGLAALGTAAGALPNQAKVIRLGYQVVGDLLQARGVLEKRLSPLGVEVKWFRFSSGPPLLEALNAGALDFGPTGETPPIFAQAAGAKLVYVINVLPGTGEALALVVTSTSPIRRTADLRGKRIAIVQGSAAQYFLVKALAEVGVAYRDVKIANLAPGDAQTAFFKGDLDAWVTWDPFLIRAKQSGARVLRDSRGISTQGAYFLASREFAEQNLGLLQIILGEYQKIGAWANTHPDEVAAILGPLMNLDAQTVKIMRRHQPYAYRAIDRDTIERQQQIADLFFRLGILPKPISVREATLTPAQYAQLARSPGTAAR